MGNRLGEQDGYPAGVSNADFAGDERPCDCGHAPGEHGPRGCEVDDCPCDYYDPE